MAAPHSSTLNSETLLLGLLFVAVVAGALGLFAAIGNRLETRRRLEGQAGGAVRLGGVQSGGAQAPPTLRPADSRPLLRRVMQRVRGKLIPDDPVEQAALRLALLQAGFASPHAASVYYLIRLGLAALFPLLFLLARPWVAPHLAGNRMISTALIAIVVGYGVPGMVLSHLRGERRQRCREGFPDALDLLLICVESGLGLDAAIVRVAQEIGFGHPLVALHFHQLELQLQAGRNRDDALRAFALHMGLEEAAALAALMSQTAALGTSMGDALRAQADDMRAHRVLMAEEKAQAMGVKLSFPLVGLIVPSLLLIVAAPAVVRLAKSLMPVLNQLSTATQ